MKKNYTLIELLAAMTIFIIMMGILFNVFSVGADIASSQQTKVEILSDANVFFTFVTDDLRNIDIDSIEQIKDKNNAYRDPDTNTTSNEATGTKLEFSSTMMAFYSDVRPYDQGTLITDLAGLKPYVAYEYIAADKAIVRTMFKDDASYTATGSVGDDTPVILEGVSAFEIKIWDDYPGGTELTASPLASKPSCITVSVTLTNPNPNASATLTDRQKRTVTKTIYIDR